MYTVRFAAFDDIPAVILLLTELFTQEIDFSPDFERSGMVPMRISLKEGTEQGTSSGASPRNPVLPYLVADLAGRDPENLGGLRLDPAVLLKRFDDERLFRPLDGG